MVVVPGDSGRGDRWNKKTERRRQDEYALSGDCWSKSKGNSRTETKETEPTAQMCSTAGKPCWMAVNCADATDMIWG